MHEIEPYYGWNIFYDSSMDEASPFYGKEYNYDLYSEAIYDHFIDPAWDFMGSETLYIKILFADYSRGFAIIEFIGEWNDAINNDIMHLKRNIIEVLQYEGINKFILIGENVLNFHGSDDCYYDEWQEEVGSEVGLQGPGWIAAVNFRDHVIDEWTKYNIPVYLVTDISVPEWRAMLPFAFFKKVDSLIRRKIELR